MTASTHSTNQLEEAGLPRYVRVADELRRQIREGVLVPGAALPSFPAMKSQYGISQTTLERAHAILHRENLIVRERGRGVFVGAPTKRESTGVLGVVGGGFGDLAHDFYWQRLMNGIRRAAGDAGWKVLLIDQPGQWSSYEKVDGILIANMDAHEPLMEFPPGMPVVSLLIPRPNLPWVASNDFEGGRLATRHLLELGHRNIAFLISDKNVLSAARLEGYREELRAAGAAAPESFVRECDIDPDGSDFEKASRRVVLEWLDQGWDEAGLTALITHNDHMSIGAIRGFQDRGRVVPRDVSVIGFDGTELCDYFTPALSSVEIPLRQIGERSVEMLLGRMRETNPAADQTSSCHWVIEPQLRPRASTGAQGSQ